MKDSFLNNKNNNLLNPDINHIHNYASRDNILYELISLQRKDIIIEKKLSYSDLKRVSKYLNSSIFKDECSIWTGYITVIKNDEKKSYINFYFNNKKYSLHRILYINYIGELLDSEYIKFYCVNKGKCCNINHFYKINKDNNNNIIINNNIINENNNNIIDENNNNKNIKNIIVDFNL